jgi:hypothetical protein
MTITLSDPRKFLRCFFSDGNAIRWGQYQSAEPNSTVRSTLTPWVTRFEMQRSPFCLPRVDPQSKQTTWYVMCSDPREARSVREALQAFIGPTYADFNGELAAYADGDSIDHLCHATFGLLVFRLPVKNGGDRKKVNSLLATLIDFRDRESSRSLAAIKPIGRLLRDLEMAIIGCNEESAWQIYAEIRSRGRLSAVNLAFLQVRILGSFDHWTEILSMPNLSDLLQVRRPKRISEQIAKSVYRQFFLKFEEANDPESAIDSYRSVGVRYQNLLRSTDGLQSPDALKFAVLNSVAADPPNRELAERLIESSVCESDRPWCRELLSRLETPSTVRSVVESVESSDMADLRYNEGNFDEAFKLYLDRPQTYASVCRVLETAVEIDSKAASEKAFAYLNAASHEIQGKVLERKVCVRHTETLTSILGQSPTKQTKPILSLSEWIECVDNGENTENLNQVLYYGIHDWASDPTLNPKTIAEALGRSRKGATAETVRNAVPQFLREFLIVRAPSRENKPIYNSLIELLIYDDKIGSDDLIAVEQLVEAILTIAPGYESGNNDFVFAVDVTKHLWETVAAPRHLDWALSMLDLLIDTGTQQHATLTPVLAAITDSFRSWSRRVSDDQWAMLELLAKDLDLAGMLEGVQPVPDEKTTSEQIDLRSALKGMSIAVYSLTERIARRFGQLAERTFDDIKIHYIHDKSLTDRMKSLAQSVDIFIVNTWDAKHAATNGVKDYRPQSATTLEPDGKSASSLMRCLQECASRDRPGGL